MSRACANAWAGGAFAPNDLRFAAGKLSSGVGSTPLRVNSVLLHYLPPTDLMSFADSKIVVQRQAVRQRASIGKSNTSVASHVLIESFGDGLTPIQVRIHLTNNAIIPKRIDLVQHCFTNQVKEPLVHCTTFSRGLPDRLFATIWHQHHNIRKVLTQCRVHNSGIGVGVQILKMCFFFQL